MKYIFVFAACALAWTASVHAEPSANAKRMASEIIEINNQVSSEDLARMNAMFRAKLKEEDDPRIVSMFGGASGDFFTEADIGALNRASAERLAEVMSESDLKQVSQFLKSPAGKNFKQAQEQLENAWVPVLFQIMAQKVITEHAKSKQESK